MTDTSTLARPAATQEAEQFSLGSGSPPVKVFQGTNSVIGRGRATAVTGETKTVAGRSEIRYRLCLDTESLSQALNITQSVNVGFGLFGASEKTEFIKNTKQTSFSLTLVVYARHVTGIETATDWTLVPGVAAPKTDADKRAFFNSYGDSFVSSLEMGGEYYAVYSFYTQTFEEQQSLKIELTANGIFEAGSFGADFQSKIENSIAKTKVRVSTDQMVTGQRNPTLPATKDIVDYALNFTRIEPDAPAIVECTALGYEHVPTFGDFQPIAGNRDFFLGSDVEGGLYGDLLKSDALYNSLTWLVKTYSTYGGYDDKPVSNVLIEATNDLNTLRTLVVRYNTDPMGTFTKPELKSLTHGTPKLQFVTSWSYPWGGDGGGEFDDVDTAGFIPSLTRIRAIQLRSGTEVDSLLTTYTDVTGRQWTDTHGGSGGGLGPELTLLESERVTEISARKGQRVVNLGIRTNLGRSVSGGGDSGDTLVWSVPAGRFLLGFRGRSGTELDRIQAVYASFKPAAWVK